MTPPIPISRFLVPDRAPTAPDGFTTVSVAMLAGLPHAIPIDQEIRLLVVAPTGLATMWRDTDLSSIVSWSDEEVSPIVPSDAEPPGGAAFLPVRLLLQTDNRTVAAMPLRAGIRRLLPDSGSDESGVRIEVIVLSWRLAIGSIRGAGDFGSRLTIAWRRANEAVDLFSAPPPHPVLVKRLPPENRMMSLIGYDLAIARLYEPHLRYRKQKVFRR